MEYCTVCTGEGESKFASVAPKAGAAANGCGAVLKRRSGRWPSTQRQSLWRRCWRRGAVAAGNGKRSRSSHRYKRSRPARYTHSETIQQQTTPARQGRALSQTIHRKEVHHTESTAALGNAADEEAEKKENEAVSALTSGTVGTIIAAYASKRHSATSEEQQSPASKQTHLAREGGDRQAVGAGRGSADRGNVDLQRRSLQKE
jgi:hypothetical protein